MSFSLTVNEDEIQSVLRVIQEYVYPEQIALGNIGWYVFGEFCSYTGEIEMRKVRLCIQELRKRGYLIIAKRGYSIAGDDSAEAIHFVNGLYSRAHKLTQEADNMFRLIKQKYGDEVSAKVEMVPGQPGLEGIGIIYGRKEVEPPYHKSYTAR